jgi:hypothetical protein
MTERFVSPSVCLVGQGDYFSGTLPQLDIVSIDELLGSSDGRIVVVAGKGFRALDAAVAV